MSDVGGPYDPNAIDGDASGGTQYIRLKDLRVWGIALAIFAVPMFFIYKVLEGNSERHRCITNLAGINTSLNLYAVEHDNRYPPMARTEGDGVTPSLLDGKRPYTWVSDVAPYMKARQTFSCPTATAPEKVANESAESATASVVSTYGMYAPYGGVLTSLVESPDQVVLVAETSNLGSRDTSDPTPFANSIPDGFAIGWTNTNTLPDAKTEGVSRLAFPGSAKGKRDEGRHGKFLQALTASGELIQLVPGDAQYRVSGVGGVNPHWRLPPGYRAPGG